MPRGFWHVSGPFRHQGHDIIEIPEPVTGHLSPTVHVGTKLRKEVLAQVQAVLDQTIAKESLVELIPLAEESRAVQLRPVFVVSIGIRYPRFP
jgi:hypothetical protein